MTQARNLGFFADGLSSTGVAAVTVGGTGVTVSSGASSVVLRDSNSNITANYLYPGFSNTAAAGTTTTLTAASVFNYNVTGSGGQTFKLPDATTLSVGAVYTFNNNQTSGTIVVQNNSTTTLSTIQSGGFLCLTLLTNSVAAGTWDTHYQAPSNVTWSTNTLDYAGSITSATWNGVAVAVNRGGTGSSTLTANNVLLGNGTSALQVVAPGSSGNVLTSNGTTWQSSTPTASSSSAKVWSFYTSSSTYTVPTGVTSIRVYAFGAGGDGGVDTSTATGATGGGGGGCAYGDLAVTAGQTVTITISSGVATVSYASVTRLTANKGGNGGIGSNTAGAGGTASKDASITNGGAYSGGAGGNFTIDYTPYAAGGGGSSGSPLGVGLSQTNNYAIMGGSGWNGQGSGQGVGGNGGGTDGGSPIFAYYNQSIKIPITSPTRQFQSYYTETLLSAMNLWGFGGVGAVAVNPYSTTVYSWGPGNGQPGGGGGGNGIYGNNTYFDGYVVSGSSGSRSAYGNGGNGSGGGGLWMNAFSPNSQYYAGDGGFGGGGGAASWYNQGGSNTGSSLTAGRGGYGGGGGGCAGYNLIALGGSGAYTGYGGGAIVLIYA